MAHQTLSIVQEFPQPPSAVFAYLSHHDNLGSVFGAPVERIQAGSDPSEPNGVGSVRRLEAGVISIEETVLLVKALDRGIRKGLQQLSRSHLD